MTDDGGDDIVDAQLRDIFHKTPTVSARALGRDDITLTAWGDMTIPGTLAHTGTLAGR